MCARQRTAQSFHHETRVILGVLAIDEQALGKGAGLLLAAKVDARQWRHAAVGFA